MEDLTEPQTSFLAQWRGMKPSTKNPKRSRPRHSPFFGRDLQARLVTDPSEIQRIDERLGQDRCLGQTPPPRDFFRHVVEREGQHVGRLVWSLTSCVIWLYCAVRHCA